ncbi:protein bunched, class 1/class 3/D/E isoforms-like isoform X2 [Limulus polyphemus]|uniref:Protein bunched, class 1/class 3/D/E isoforms-like isoform X2 n=1 Tax=Limulus polyphemus TaxID=6850 RepID=A0ABM1TDU7_LIMPO|nr:protein bunched, class 1/class 3/D/E isoforms-like isoform X2 [Limulus polyphemus]
MLPNTDLDHNGYWRRRIYVTNLRNGTPPDSSAVTIDNKIEQAMDLVKSHLIFAVREEVDVLKAKIAELKEKILRLEHENGILKAHASQEVLNNLSKGGLQSVSQTQLQQKPLVTAQVSYQSQRFT